MINLLSICALGFFLGMRHATDPDHVIAVTTIVSRRSSVAKAALTGIFWGIGHTITIVVVGAIIIFFDVVIPARVGLSMEFSVGLMLVALGAMNIVSFIRSSRSISSGLSADATSGDPAASAFVHSHPHSHEGHIHSHTHVHSANGHPHEYDHAPVTLLDRWFGRTALYQQVRPLVVGVVHGLAGSAAVALLVLTTIRDPRWAVAYLLIFGVGTIGGMMLITVSIASAFSFLGRGQEKFSRRLGLASGLFSLVFGVVLAYQIGIAHGLFTGHPQWIPR